MKITDRIYWISGGPWGYLGNAYAIKHSDGYVLVDTGSSEALDVIVKNLKYWNIDENKITHVLITHAHDDHTGCAHYFQKCGAKIVIGKADSKMLEDGHLGEYSPCTNHIMPACKADILIEVVWNINTMGPKRSVTYTLRGLDAYTNKQVAATQGTGEPSMAAEVAVLLEEAVVDKMDAFVSQLQKHFDDLMANGREVALEVRVFDNGSGVNLESEFGGAELQEIIEDWVAQNTVAHRFSLTDATENMMLFEQVRIPLYRENGMARDTRSFANDLRKYLNQKANLTCKVMTKGLGKAELVIGEK